MSKAADIVLSADPGPANRRLAFLDNLKVFLVTLVIFHHAGQPYGPTGGDWLISHTEKFRLLGTFFHINASFFMGLFFLISGYFVVTAYEGKGSRRYLLDRLQRFGLPVLVFGLIVVPALKHLYRHLPWADCFLPFTWAHLWFLGHLMVYTVLYVIYRRYIANAEHPQIQSRPFPANRYLIGYAVLLTIACCIVRHWYPIDVWVNIGVPSELAHLPQYASLYLFGVVAGRQRWLEVIPRRTGRLWLTVGLIAIVARLTYSVCRAHFLNGDGLLMDYVWYQWEALLCVGMCVGLPYVFQHYLAYDNRVTQFAARYAFAVYIIHLPTLILIQAQLEATALGPLTLTIVSGSATLLLCYAMAAAYGASTARLKAAAHVCLVRH